MSVQPLGEQPPKMTVESEILVYDEDAKTRKQAVTVLESMGLKVVQAEDLKEAVRCVRNSRPSIVIAGVKQGKSGVDFIEQVSGHDPSVMIVALVDEHGSAKLVIDLLRAGAIEFARRPLSANEMKALLSRLVLATECRKQTMFQPGTVHTTDLDIVISSLNSAIEATVKLIGNMLSGVVDHAQMIRFELAVDEALRNAYEHGCLGLSGSEKLSLCRSEALEEFLRGKELEAIEAGKTIHISAKCNEKEFSCVIEDQGAGFDWREVPLTPEGSGETAALNGRGLMLIRNVFDIVAFNEKGNKVTLVKKLS
jgi:anti-sigma regulatory factor (Ser/Thr protein kinase)